MPSTGRLPAIALLLLLAALAALFSGGGVATCLGPLGVTVVQCWAAAGVPPSVGPGAPLAVACLGGALLVATGFPRPLRLAAVVPAAAALLAGAAYVALRPTTMRGPTSTGEVISIDLPLEPVVLATAAVAGAAVALVALAAAQRVRARLRPSAWAGAAGGAGR